MLSERVDSAHLKELASKGVSLSLRLQSTGLARLSAYTENEDSELNAGAREELVVQVKFDIGPEDYPRVGLSIEGCLCLKCQRCLEPLAWPVRIEACLTLLDSDAQTETIESPFDSVLIDTDGLDLAGVIEDEILAAMPMVPVHGDDSRCRPAGGEEGNLAANAELTQRPFADLAALIGDRKCTADD